MEPFLELSGPGPPRAGTLTRTFDSAETSSQVLNQGWISTDINDRVSLQRNPAATE
jgi:hypothetical protein